MPRHQGPTWLVVFHLFLFLDFWASYHGVMTASHHLQPPCKDLQHAGAEAHWWRSGFSFTKLHDFKAGQKDEKDDRTKGWRAEREWQTSAVQDWMEMQPNTPSIPPLSILSLLPGRIPTFSWPSFCFFFSAFFGKPFTIISCMWNLLSFVEIIQ